jgi:O6-methylguanine-DNA--protein-cysteine methyltransferase
LIPNYKLKECHENHPEFALITEIVSLKKSFEYAHNFLRDEEEKKMISYKKRNLLSYLFLTHNVFVISETPLALACYDLMRQIPCGKVTTYKILADKIGT